MRSGRRACGASGSICRNVPAIRISDRTEPGRLAFDLADLLAILGEPARESIWKCHVGECVLAPGARPHLYDAFNVPERISGSSLLVLAAETAQVIDGAFEAFRPGEKRAWIKLGAVGGACWDVVAPDPNALSLLAARFRQVEPIDEGVA
jgi:hypothetical protein